MSLEGAKLICLNADDNGQFETIPANGKTFKFGYYMDCDVVLEHPDAMGLQCVINCDAFGRVTIENRCSDQPITLDGKTLIKMRPLLHNTEICIMDKKYLWQFDGNPKPKGFQMEDINDFTTPSKQANKPQQPPNSEPARKWRRPLQTRLTIHSFAYCIKAGESPQDVETTTDENKPLNIHERIIDADVIPNKRLSSSPPPVDNISDFIDLNTPKIEQRSFSRRDQPLSCCKLSETVITSYSPRETGIRQEKSFARVQSPLITSKVQIGDVSLGPFHHIISPQTIQNCRPSMHLIDLITPKKLIPPASSPTRTLLKSTLKKNLPKGTSPQTPQKHKKAIDLSTPGSSETVYSVRSTDDESVIILSDDCNASQSPNAKTPSRVRTPQSLMKRAILSSAKKVAVNKKLLNLTGSKQTFTPIKNPTTIRFQSQSTPQRKSLGRFPSSAESLSAGKPRRSLVTSTPFRQRAEIVSSSSSKRSLLLSSSSQLSSKKESRNSLMLKQALSMTPTTTVMTQKRKSGSCMKSQNKPRKSVSFLEQVEKDEKANFDEVEKSLNNTFTIEEDSKNEFGQVVTSHRKDPTFTPEKVNCKEERGASECQLQSKVSLSPEKLSIQSLSTTPKSVPGSKSSSTTDTIMITSSLKKPTGSDVLHSAAKSKNQASIEINTELTHSLSIVSQVEIISDNQKQLDKDFHEELTADKNPDPQSPKSSKNLSKINDSQNIREDTDYDFDGVDEIFKTPKAKNIMILSSPKSISLQKPASDSVELVHSTEFDFSANLDELFQTPQSEFISRRVDGATPAISAPIEALSPEEAFDMLVGRPIVKKKYARKTPAKKQELSPLKISNDPTLPKTDIEEWIDSVNDLLEDSQNEDEMSYLTATMDEISQDPLMAPSVSRSTKSNKRATVLATPRDELEMTIKEENKEEENKVNHTILKDPLETNVPRSLSPNISGICLLDHTSESIFSETLALSDDSSLKDTEKTQKLSDDQDEIIPQTENQTQLNVSQEDKARREIEEAFKNFEKQRKALDEKRLASTPEPKKPSVSKIAQRRTMGNQLSSNTAFDPKANAEGLGESIDKTLILENKKKEIRISGFEFDTELKNTESDIPLEKSLVSKVKLILENNKDQNSELGNLTTNLSYEQVEPEQNEVISTCQVEQELELVLENFEDQPEFSEKRLVVTPEPKKITMDDQRRTVGSALVSDVKLDLQASKSERELELTFENFEEEPEFSEQRVVKTPEPKKIAPKDHRRTLGSALVQELKLDLQAAKAERELELAFENFEEEPEFTEQRVVKTPEPKKIAPKDHRRTLGSALVQELKLDLQAAKAERELEVAFENYEEQPEFSEHRKVKTPEPKKISLKDHRRTVGSALVHELKLDLQAAKAERDLEIAFENFEEQPEFSEQRVVKTPEPMKVTIKDHRRTLGSSLVPELKLDLQAAKAERELELAFQNFEEQPEFSEQRVVKTPEPKKISLKDHRRTVGSALVQEVKLDLQAAKAARELEVAFENFEEEPEFTEQRVVKTPEPKKIAPKDHRRTLGSALVQELKLDLQAAKAERELELAFENFEEEPEFTEQRVVKTPEPKKIAPKDHRRTLGSALVQELKLDLQAAKAERELEVAFENFEEQPEFSEHREVKTPEPKKISLKDHRRTVGSALVTEVKLDFQAAKNERELEVAFENFEEEPEFTEQRVVKTPEPKKIAPKDHRRTLGSALVQELKLDLQAAKAARELEVAFENFEEQPEFSEHRKVKTPEHKKISLKDHRRTVGSALVHELKLDLQAAKAERDLEIAFENFEEQPEFSEQWVVKTPEPKKVIIKDHRRTLGSSLVPEVKLDLQAAKAERELELAFQNFEEQPEFSEQRVVKTPEPKKISLKDHRRTVGSALVQEVKLDLQAAKAARELEVAFENFEEEPEFTEQRVVKTPEPKKIAPKDHRRTVGSALVQELKLDLQAAKAERELELAFENFEEEPEFTEQRIVKTPEPKNIAPKDHRRTLGSALMQELKLDLQAAKAERELEVAFENFEEQPEFSEHRKVKTPEPKKISLKDHRRTVGSALVTEVKIDLQAAKDERELELAFQNFEEEPEFTEQRVVKTPEPKKIAPKDHRRTLGSALVPELKLDLQAAKAERELEVAFENFEEQPEFSEHREVKTPEPKKISLKDHRRTVGSALVHELKLDLQAAKAARDLEVAFENFDEEPKFTERVVKTPEPKKIAPKDHRRTLGSALVQELKLDLEAAKAERELELAFENFEEEPEFTEQRVVKTPEPQKIAPKDHRRTLGSALMQELKLDLQAAKAERELEVAFENFEEQPEFSEHRDVKTPEPKKISLRDHRRTVGSALVHELKLDLQAAKAERDLEIAFENFEEQPEFSEQRVVKTPEPKKVIIKDHRRTLGSSLVPEVKLDLQAAKAERELELAFENFEEEPEFSEHREIKTPEPRKVALKDHRRTLGSSLVPEVKLDLQAAKAERELEVAFENFEEQPEFSEHRKVKTPEPKKISLKDHRRTVGSGLVQELKLDLQAAKAERELELAFENFEEQPEFSEQRVVKTPEPKKVTIKDHRRTLGSSLVPKVKLDLQAAKAERELELVFEHFEEEPEFSENREVKTPEPKKVALKDHRRTVGSALVQDVKLDPQAAKAERELEVASENLEEQPEILEQWEVVSQEPMEVILKDKSALLSKVKLELQVTKAALNLELDKTSRTCYETMNVTQTPQRKWQEIINETETAERTMLEVETNKEEDKEHQPTIDEENTHTIESGSNLLVDSVEVSAIEESNESYIFQKGKSRIKEEMELKNVKKDFSANNDEQQIEKPDTDSITEIIRLYKEVASTPTRSLRRRRNTTDEDDKTKPHPIAFGKQERVNEECVDKKENSNTPALRRTRKKTVESLDGLKSSAAEEMSVTHQTKSQDNLPQMRRTRQNSVDSLTDVTKSSLLHRKEHENLPQMRRTRQNSVDTLTDDTKSTRLPSNDLKASNNEEEPIKTTNLRIDSTDVDSTEDEVAQTSRSTRKKRIRKIAPKTSETPLKETELHHILEPIDEEGVNSELKIINQNIEAESLISLRSEADEITSLSPIVSRSRIRGRKAQLNVVLIESNDVNTSVTDKDSTNQVDSVNNYIETHEDGNSKEECNEKMEMTNDADESIPSTPLPLRSRGRRPSKPKVPSNLLVPALRKTRRGSVQEDVEVQTVDKVEATHNKSDSKFKSNIPKDDSKPGNDVLVTEAVDEDIVPSTPVDKKARRRQLPNKQKISLADLITKDVKLEEKIEPNEIEDIITIQGNAEATEIENSMQRHENDTLIEDNVEKNVTSSTVPSKTRGRRAILKHKIVPENLTSVQVATTTEDIVSHKQIICTEEESGDKVQLALNTSKTCETKSVSENNISEDIQTKSPTICDEKITSVKQENCTTEGSMKNLESALVEIKKEVPTSPVLSKTRGRRAASKVKIEPERATPNRRVGRPKKTNLPTKDKVEDQENDTQDDEKNAKNLDASTFEPERATPNPRVGRPKKTNLPTKDKVEDQENDTQDDEKHAKDLDASSFEPERATPNRRVGRPKKTNLPTKDKVEDQENDTQDDEKNAKDLDASSLEPERATPNRRVGRPKKTNLPTKDKVEDQENDTQDDEKNAKDLDASSFEPERATPNRRVGRPKKTNLPTKDKVEDQENDTQDDEKNAKNLDASSSDSTRIFTSTKSQNQTPAGIQNNTTEITSNTRVGRRKAIEKTVLGTDSTDETRFGEDNSNNDAKAVEVPHSDVFTGEEIGNGNEASVCDESDIPSQTRGRRAALKPDTGMPAVRRGRKRAAEQIFETQQLQQQLKDTENHEDVKINVLHDRPDSRNQGENGDNVVDVEKLIIPCPTKKRGRKAAAKIEPSAPKTKTADCTEETQSLDDSLNVHETFANVGEAPFPDVFKAQEIKKTEDVVESNMPSKTRGRRAAGKPENVVPTSRRGRKRNNQQMVSETNQLQENKNHEEEFDAYVQDCQLDSTNQGENGHLASVSEETMTPVPAKKRGRKAAVKIESELSTPAFATPVRRAGRRKLVEIPVLSSEKMSSPAEAEHEGVDTEGVSIQTPVATPVRRAGRRKLVEIPVLNSEKMSSPAEAENEGVDTEGVPIQTPTPARRGVRRNIPGKAVNIQKSPEAEKLTTEIREEQDESAKLSPTLSKTVASKVLLTSKSEGLVVETSTPTESNVELPKSRGRRGYQKIEVNTSKINEHAIELVTNEDKTASHPSPNPIKSEPLSAENSPSVQNRRRKRPAVRGETTEKESQDLTKHTHKTTFRKETETLNESLTTETDNHENVPATKRTRRAPAKLTEFIVSNLVQQVKTEILENISDNSETEVHNPTSSKKREQPVTAKFDNIDCTQEDSTPVGKRGRRAIVKIDDHKESVPPKRVARHGKAKDEPAETLIQDQQKDDNKHNTSCELISVDEKPEERTEKRTTRRLPFSEEQPTQIEVKTQSKPTRGRGKPPLKIKPSLESTSHTDDEQFVSTTKPKSNRGRKAATKSDPEKEITQDKTSNSEQNPNIKSEISNNEDKEKVDEKPKRGRKAAKAEPVDKPPVTIEPSPVIKKTTRGRKAAAKNDVVKSEDQSFQLDVLTTRSGKEEDKDARPVARRRNLEKLTDNDQEDDTPSKRTRRKPNKLLSDDFIT